MSDGTKNNNKRVSFLEQQVQQAKTAYETSLETVIEECISLKLQAAKKEETEIVMDILSAIGSAIQTLQGIDCDKDLQSINIVTMSLNLLKFSLITTPDTFFNFYKTYHSLNTIPKASIVIPEAEYSTIEECTKASTKQHGLPTKNRK